MKKRVLLTVVCIGMLSGPVTAAPPLARRVPADTLVYLGWSGTKGPAFAGSTFGQLLNEPVARQILAAVKKAILQDMRQKDERDAFEHVWSMGLIALNRPIAVAWTGLHETRKGSPIPTGAILIDLGKDKRAFAGHVDALIDLAPPVAKEKIKKATVGNVTYRTIQEGNDPAVSFGYAGNVFFVSLGPGAAADVITLNPAKSLATNRTFAARMKDVGPDNEVLSMYVDVTGIRKLVEPLIKAAMGQGQGPTPGQIFGALGLADVQAVASSTRIVQGGMTTRTKIFSPGPHRGLLMLLAGKPLTKDDLSHVLADVDFMSAANISPSRVWQEIRAGVRSIDPQAEQQMLQGLAQPEKMLGLSFEKDLLGNMGDTWVLSSAESQGGFITGTVLTVELKDARAFGIAVGKIEAFFEAMLASKRNEAARVRYTCPMHPHVREARPGQCPICKMKLVEGGARKARPSPSIETVKVGRTEIRYVAMPVGPVPVAPAWAIHKNRLYIAGFPQVLQAAIENDGKDPLAASADFAKYRARVSQNASMLSYVNTPKILSKVYNIALVVWTLAANAGSAEAGLPMKPDWLPAMSKLAKYLAPTVSAVSSDKTGITFERHGSLPFGGLFGGLGPMGAAFLMPMAARAEHRAVEVRERARLREEEVRREVERLEDKQRTPDRARPPRRPVRKDGDF